ncbi:MAG: TolC family protein, partial [Pyrinomonadaceae bacterium]
MNYQRKTFSVTLICAALLLAAPASLTAQSQSGPPAERKHAILTRYIDPQAGMSADDLVVYALAHNLELLAAHKEIDAAQAMVRQARLRANPMLDLEGTRQITGKDNTLMATAKLPLELGGRRPARIAVAEREVDVRVSEVANRERLLATEVRQKFGEALAQSLKLSFADQLVESNLRTFDLVVARVTEGATAPLEQNMVLVEVNRLRSQRETAEGQLEVLMLELRNLMGMPGDETLRLRGDFSGLTEPMISESEATVRGLNERADLRGFRAMEDLAEALIEQARSEGRLDASVSAGYQRMNSSFPVFGVNDQGQLQPVQSVFNFFKFGVSLDLPVRNKNQGAIEAAVYGAEAATQKREFAQLTVRREIAAAFAQYFRNARAMEIYRVGVLDQARVNLDVVRQT